MREKEGGFTIVELMVCFAVLAILGLAFFDLLNALLRSAVVSQRQATALTLATTQIEYLKDLPYDNLAVTGGPIESSQTIPATINKTVNGHKYIVTTSIVYVDDAYDGCGSYPNATIKQQYCRNYPPPSGAPSVDTNPADYKDARVTISDNTGLTLATLDTDISPLVAETASNTGALFVKVVDNAGNPIEGATVSVVNNSVNPNVNVSDTSDQNGIVIFYDLTPDSNYDYVVNASDTGYSTLQTIANSGSLSATYPNQKLIAQNSSYATMTLEPEGEYSLELETTDTSGNPLPGAKIYVKGGYKDYTSTSNTAYYYDTVATNNSPTTDSSGLYGLLNLVPGTYIFCGDSGSTSCSIGGTTYYLAAAVPYGGSNPINPIIVPTYDSDSPPTTTYSYNGNSYLQKVRLMLTTSSTFPRVNQLTPYDGSLSSGTLANFTFTLSGENLPCTSRSSSCNTKVNFLQNSNTYTASCTGSSAGISLSCSANLASASIGNTQLQVIVGSNTLTLPASPLLGGLIIDQ